MKRLVICIILCTLLFASFAVAETPYSNILCELSHEDLDGLMQDVNAEIKLHHQVTDEEKETILPIVKRETESYYAGLGLKIDWAWYGSEYEYTQQWDFYTLKTHIDYKDTEDKNQQKKVYAELFPLFGVLTVCYLQSGDLIITDRRSEVPEQLLLDNSPRTYNMRIGIDLSTMDPVALNALKQAIEDEIKLNHTVDNSVEHQVYELVKTTVESHYSELGISVSWPWFDYSYTHDWGCYTETTRIGFTDSNSKRQDLPVYGEAFLENGVYDLYYLTIGDQVLFDHRDQLTDTASIMLINSRQYPIAVEHAVAGNYTEAIRIWRSIGDYSDSSSQADAYQTIVDEQSYTTAKELMKNGKYDEAITAFTALNGYSDSTDQIVACKAAIQEEDYLSAIALMKDHQYEFAIAAFEALGTYSDCTQQIAACRTAINDLDLASAKNLMDNHEYEAAIAAFEALQGYGDSQEMIDECHETINAGDYTKALQLKALYRFEESAAAFEALNGYSDSVEQMAECRTALSSIDRTIAFPQPEMNIYIKQKVVLEPVVTVLQTDAPDNTTLSFSSGDEHIAKVDKKGAVTGVASGDVYINCFAEDNLNIGTTILVHVVVHVDKVSMSTTKLELMISELNELVGQSSLSITIEPQNAFIQTVTWSSSNEKVATVNTDGMIQAVGTGKATITAQSNDTSESPKKAVCSVVVSQAVDSLTFDASEGIVFVGMSETLIATPLPKTAANKKLTWASSNEAVATVSSSGKVTGVSTGTATITATAASGITAQYSATVKFAPTVMRVTAKATIIAKNSVGHDWTYEFYLDEVKFTKSTKITVEEGQTVKVECLITENDKNPDTNGFSEDIIFTGEELKNGRTISRTVYVTENGGRYSGNSAEWEVVITFKP